MLYLAKFALVRVDVGNVRLGPGVAAERPNDVVRLDRAGRARYANALARETSDVGSGNVGERGNGLIVLLSVTRAREEDVGDGLLEGRRHSISDQLRCQILEFLEGS